MDGPTDGATRVLVVDDHATFAELLAEALDREPDLVSVGHVTSMGAALTTTRDLRPDLVMMDVELPDGDGFAATERLTAEFPELRVIILTAHTDAGFVVRAAQAGACGFLAKDGSLAQMLETIRRASVGSFAFEPPPGARGTLQVPPREQQAKDEPRPPTLTPRELDVLRLMAAGVHVRAIAEQLGITEQTCRGYVKTLLIKLEAHSQLQAVVTAWRLGLLRTGADG